MKIIVVFMDFTELDFAIRQEGLVIQSILKQFDLLIWQSQRGILSPNRRCLPIVIEWATITVTIIAEAFGMTTMESPFYLAIAMAFLLSMMKTYLLRELSLNSLTAMIFRDFEDVLCLYLRWDFHLVIEQLQQLQQL